MNREIKMSISSMTRAGDKKAVYVLFTDKDSSAEFTIPGCQLLSSHGFAEEDLMQLKEYIDNEQDYLFSLAKEINPIRSFLGDRKLQTGKERGEQVYHDGYESNAGNKKCIYHQ